jgi:Ser-tRNA(Ala) deacylase AlaX
MNSQLNDHNKQEYPPMHTAEHILNQTMTRMFGCPRSRNTHIERKKSKCDYFINQMPTAEQVQEIENTVNEIINSNLKVSEDFVHINDAADLVDLSKLPNDVSEMLRIIRVGDYDVCACIGSHVECTSEIGEFKITTHTFENGRWRVRFKLKEV